MPPPQQLDDTKKALQLGATIIGTIIAAWAFIEYFSKSKTTTVKTTPCGTCTDKRIST